MSLTKRTYTDILGNTLVSTGSVTGATTKLTMVFTANNTLWGVQSTINVYVDGTKVTFFYSEVGKCNIRRRDL